MYTGESFHLRWPAYLLVPVFMLVALLNVGIIVLNYFGAKDQGIDVEKSKYIPNIIIIIVLAIPMSVVFSLTSTITIAGDKVILSQRRCGCIPWRRKEYDLRTFEGMELLNQLGCGGYFDKKNLIMKFSDGRTCSLMALGQCGYSNDDCSGSMARFVDEVNECVGRTKKSIV